MKTNVSKPFIIAISVIGLVGAYSLGVQSGLEKSAVTEAPKTPVATSSEILDLAPFWKTFETLNDRFVATTASSSVPTDKEKVYGAIEGLTASYGDPYTIFFPPKETTAFEEEVRGSFEGVGMEIAIKDKVLTVVAPLKNTPAERAGIQPGDQILKIDKKGSWFFHISEHMLLNGSSGNPKLVPTSLSLNKIIEIVKSIR
ncbi:MAG: Carboxyl-terminal protease [Candidatus Nomurabacteria bacterium GW2011_GWD1_44_10]|nr:MAG: Carboxyl-terminal protease [Candidatus Nomurabacteria bacterium GW2011_GWD1_44_10]